MKAFVATLITAGLLIASGDASVAQSGNDLFQQALVKERTAGDINAAIALYQTIVQHHTSDRALVARALVQMGGCHEKLGSGDAVKTYERVVREFGDQKESVGTARARLATLKSPAIRQPGQRRIWDNVNQWSYDVRAPSGDGRYLSFTGDKGDLGVLDLVEGTSRYLTNLGAKTNGSEEAASSLVSPDGRQVVYGWHPPDKPDELRLIPMSGRLVQPRILQRDQHPQENTYPFGWTPDGNQVLVLRELADFTAQIAFISVADGSLRVVKSIQWWNQLGEASLSPDGRLIAYSASAGAGVPAHDIFLLAADGSRETVVVKNPAEDRQPVWSPDGSQLLFASNRTGTNSLWTVHLDRGTPVGSPELLSENIGRLLGMTRRGALYHVTGGPTTNIYTVELDANMKVKGTRVRATDRFVNGNTDPTWSRDGQILAFRRGSAVVIRLGNTGEERVVASDLRAAGIGEWFPDGRHLLVLSNDTEQRRTGFHRLDIASGHAEPLFSVKQREGRISNVRPIVSPDGKSVYYSDESREPNKLLRFDLDSGRDVDLRSGPVVSLALSPDGASLAFFEEGWLSIMPVAGGEPRQVFGPGGGPGLRWTPDQRYLLFSARTDAGGREWFRIAVDGGAREALGQIGPIGPMSSLVVGAGGYRVTYRATDNRPYELWALENFLPKPRSSK